MVSFSLISGSTGGFLASEALCLFFQGGLAHLSPEGDAREELRERIDVLWKNFHGLIATILGTVALRESLPLIARYAGDREALGFTMGVMTSTALRCYSSAITRHGEDLGDWGFKPCQIRSGRDLRRYAVHQGTLYRLVSITILTGAVLTGAMIGKDASPQVGLIATSLIVYAVSKILDNLAQDFEESLPLHLIKPRSS